MSIFLGKVNNKFSEQIEKKCIAGGPKGSPWYGDIKLGDHVFVCYQGKIIALWKAKEYTKMKNIKGAQNVDVLAFDELKTYNDVNVSNDFTRYKYFIHDLNLVNKVTKSVKGLGFIPIQTYPDCPKPDDIEFKGNGINLYVALQDSNLEYKEGDIRVTINNIDEMKILDIERMKEGEFLRYKSFYSLYDERTKEDKYTIRELKSYAEEDNATNKLKFLISLIEELETKGYFKVSNPIKLYDNLLVGRKRSSISGKKVEPIITNDPEIDDTPYEYEKYANLLYFNPNMILYGPPGTGKTYATQKIIDAFEKKYYHSSFELSNAEGRVKTITFHQSFSYEEFIEGIRPVFQEEDSEKLGYKIENGIFKEHCINAEKELIKRQNNVKNIDMINSDSTIWKISLGERKNNDVFKECIQTNDIAIGWLENDDLSERNQSEILDLLGNGSAYGEKPTQDANTIHYFVNEMSIGDIVMVYNSLRTIRMIGVVESDYRYDMKYTYRHRRRVKWFQDLQYPIDIYKYNKKNLTMKTIYPLGRMSISDVVKIIAEKSKEKPNHEDKSYIKPYYIIIDEINRGNISKVFGELITLIEQDKRGKLKATLPYSKKEFSIPPNIFIIGTMNTADRSIAAIDTALRRRFTFVEIEPDSSVIALEDNSVVNDNVDLEKLLSALNHKILEHYDRDHRIGHAYFMGIESLSNLYQTWYYKILPLLGEYFYNDTDTLVNIVGKGFYDKYGNVNHINTNSEESGISEFEKNLVEIYDSNE